MCCLTPSVKVTTDIDSLRSEIRDKSVRVIDVRREGDYKQDHIPNSVNLPLATLLSDDSPERVLKLVNSLGIDDETPVVVYDDTFGALASRVAWTLEWIGHSDVTLLETTFGNWKSLGLEIDSLTPEISNKEHSMNLQSNILATSDYLESAKLRDDVILIDNRERLNYLEEAERGYKRTLELGECSLETWISRGDILLKLGELEAAKYNFVQALEQHPKSEELEFRIAGICFKLNEPETGYTHLLTALHFNAEHVFILEELFPEIYTQKAVSHFIKSYNKASN